MTPDQSAVAAAAQRASESLGWIWAIWGDAARAWLPTDPDQGAWLTPGVVTVTYRPYHGTYEVRTAYGSAQSPKAVLASLHGVVLHAQARKATAK